MSCHGDPSDKLLLATLLLFVVHTAMLALGLLARPSLLFTTIRANNSGFKVEIQAVIVAVRGRQ